MTGVRNIVGTVAALSLACSASGASQGAPVRLRLGTLAPQGTSYHRILQTMGERWRTATNGQVQVTVYAGTMGSELELVRRMRLGQLQAATLSVLGLREIDPGVSALEEVEFVRSRLEPVLSRRLADKGFVALFWADAGWVRYFARRPAVRPDDFKGLKLFVTAGDNEQYDLMRSAGFSPVSLEISDALTSLQTGMVDAVPIPPYFAEVMQLYTVADNMLEINWVPLVGATIISKRTWDALSPETQAALRSAADAAGAAFQVAGRSESDSAVGAMRRRGLHVIPVTPAVEAEWRATAESFYPRIRGTMVPADMFDEVRRLLTEYRQAHPAAR
jgi:TRAP-type C4-dicarboxylate transport system substrate-binding protein